MRSVIFLPLAKATLGEEKAYDNIYAQFYEQGQQVGPDYFVPYDCDLRLLIVQWIDYGKLPLD